MFWKKKKQILPGPTGTGGFYDVLDWWFWDDTHTPGLLTLEKFNKLQKVAIPEDEQGDFGSSMLMGSVVSSNGKKSKQAQKTTEHYFNMMNDYLVGIREKGNNEIDEWVGTNWVSKRFHISSFDVFKAYISVLEFWNYPYGWKEILDAGWGRALLVYHDGKPAHCLLENDIRSIRGRPAGFIVNTSRGVEWRFLPDSPQLSVFVRITEKERKAGKLFSPEERTFSVGYGSPKDSYDDLDWVEECEKLSMSGKEKDLDG